jgi:hypothetical protein
VRMEDTHNQAILRVKPLDARGNLIVHDVDARARSAEEFPQSRPSGSFSSVISSLLRSTLRILPM